MCTLSGIYFSELACFVVALEQNQRHTGIKVYISAGLQRHHFASSQDIVTATSYRTDGVLMHSRGEKQKKTKTLQSERDVRDTGGTENNH